MSSLLIRIFALLTMFAYLSVGTVALRVFLPTNSTVEISTDYLRYFSKTKYSVSSLNITAPVQKFSKEILIPHAPQKLLLTTLRKQVQQTETSNVYPLIATNEISFNEQIEVRPVFMEDELQMNLASLFFELKKENAVAVSKEEVIEDEVVTKQASVEEPEFFEYSQNSSDAPVSETVTKSQLSANGLPQILDVDKSDNVEKNVEEVAVNELMPHDYSTEPTVAAEAVAEDGEILTSQGMTNQSLGAPNNGLMKMESVKKLVKDTPKLAVTTQDGIAPGVDKPQGFVNKLEEESGATYESSLAIHAVETDFNITEDAVGFEVRPQDDLSEAISDYNSGSAMFEAKLAQPKMNRTVAILKRGHVVTNTDLILEAGTSEITIPLVSEESFNNLIAPYESRGAVGAVLVELDESTKDVVLDVPYSKVLRLDEKLKITEVESYSYQLFIGVPAGNALLSYKDSEGGVTSKIIHVHEHELTFETNFFEDVERDQVVLLEEDLLGREQTPMIISEESVKLFATDKTSTKVNDHTYKMNVKKTLLGTRQYLELLHQSEPVYIGYRDEKTVSVPSENFMRFMLSKFEGSRLGNRCLVQVNLSKKASKVDVAPESVGQSVQAYTQILDADGKFYDSAGPKSEKVVIVGETQGPGEQRGDAKINLKITYEDGSVQFLGSYCSPNTYLVEQL